MAKNNIFTEEQNKQLQEMIRENNTQDNTEYIKKMKHSKQIRKDVAFIQNLKEIIETLILKHWIMKQLKNAIFCL